MDRSFELHFCEYNRSNPDCDRIDRPKGSGDYLFLLLKTPMKMVIGQQRLITKENACILYTPEFAQDYEAVRKFRNSYLHFNCEENPGRKYGIPVNEVFYPQNCDAIDQCIQQMQEEYISDRPFAADQEYALLVQLMISTARELQKGDETREEWGDLYRRFEKLRLEMLSSYEKSWTTEMLSGRMNLEKSQLYYYYRKFFGSTPHGDLMQVRLDKAKNLLTNRALPAGQIGELCGFGNYSHFSRCFRKYCGCSPRECRNSIAEGDLE
ncbi:MAG: AraC family transcriptional regulator [Lachnospiraceae bacterium]|nr:AraC family transcriptional regulator [Lachnospiraceae bacterium]